MKYLRSFGLLLFAALSLHGQTPDCIKVFQFTAAGQFSTTIDNRQSGCTDKWTVAYQSTGFSAVSLEFDSANGAVSAGTFGAFSGTTVSGSNPMTSTTSTVSTFSGYAGWLRVKLTSVTGTGTITGVLFGYKTDLGGGGTGGSCGALGGDVSGTCAASVVIKVNGVSYGASPATDTVEIITASNTATPEALPNCPTDALGYATATHAFSCTPIAVTLAGDVTGPAGANTVVKVNGVAYSASPATDSVQVTTASNTATAKIIPNCPTNAVGYTQSTHAFSCNTIPTSGLTPTNTTNPTLTSWTWLNQNGGSIVSGNNLEYLSQPTTSANTFLTTRESTTVLNSAYTVTACVIGIVGTGAATQGYGMYLRDSGGKIVTFGFSGQNIFHRQDYTNSTTFFADSSVFGGTLFANGLSAGNGICFKMHDDLTNITMSISFDNFNYQTALVESRTAFMTGAAVAAGFYTQGSNANYPPNNSLYSWLQQ